MMNNVILIDDDLHFKDLFQVKAEEQVNPLRLIYRNSFDGLKEVMPKHLRQVIAVVLDVKCMMSEDQVKEDEGFIGTALTYLDTNCPGFPRIILTGDDESFTHLPKFFQNELIFQKTPTGLTDAFNQLNFFRENSIDIQIRNDHQIVFSLFKENYYLANDEVTLLNVLNKKEVSDFASFGGILRDIRALQETIYKTINKKSKAVVPDSVFKSNGMIDFNKLMRHLNGNPLSQGKPATSQIFQNSAIFNLSNSLYWTSGKYIHSDPAETYFISNYTIKAMSNSLMELFIWSEGYLK
ncbi:MAG: hypothetical protein Q7U54_05305 [Bacteroidales bacterium]|nr:hypothetical protein [Bacteroidales bacterium]